MSIGSGMSASLRIDHAAEDLLAGMAGIDREDLKPLGEQIFQHEEARPHVVGEAPTMAMVRTELRMPEM